MEEDSEWNVAVLELGALPAVRLGSRGGSRPSCPWPRCPPRVALVTDVSERSAVVGGAQIGSRGYTCNSAPPACE